MTFSYKLYEGKNFLVPAEEQVNALYRQLEFLVKHLGTNIVQSTEGLRLQTCKDTQHTKLLKS